jgi:hypothetical protein
MCFKIKCEIESSHSYVTLQINNHLTICHTYILSFSNDLLKYNHDEIHQNYGHLHVCMYTCMHAHVHMCLCVCTKGKNKGRLW